MQISTKEKVYIVNGIFGILEFPSLNETLDYINNPIHGLKDTTDVIYEATPIEIERISEIETITRPVYKLIPKEGN